MMGLLSVGDRVPPGDFRLHSAFRTALNFRRGEELVSVVTPEVGAGPMSIVLGSACLPHARSLRVRPGWVELGASRMRFGLERVYRSRLEIGAWIPAAFAGNVLLFGRVIRRFAPPKSLAFLLDRRRERAFRSGFERAVARSIRDGVKEFFGGDLPGGALKIRGCGFGLTPSGDDFLCGYLIGNGVAEKTNGNGSSAVRNRVFEIARSGNPLTNMFLRLARDGFLAAKVWKLVDALLRGGENDVCRAAHRVLLRGATSGADLATGLYMTLRREAASSPVREGALSWR